MASGLQSALSQLLKNGTQRSHQEAEQVHFIHEFIKGKVSREAYSKLLVSLFHVYKVMEDLWDNHWEHPLLEPLYFPDELFRTSGLRADCEFLKIDLDSELPSDATLAYVTHLRQLADSSPEMLLAHAYVRYMGDLSGGQVLKKAAMRVLQLPSHGGGTQFYEFARVPGGDLKQFKKMYRARMDSLPLDGAEAAALVDEANMAFKLNMQIFVELDRLSLFSPCPNMPSPVAGCSVCPFAYLAGSPGVELPAFHPHVTAVQMHSTNPNKEAPELRCQLGLNVAKCPLSHFGKLTPKIALAVVPLALAVGGHAMLEW